MCFGVGQINLTTTSYVRAIAKNAYNKLILNKIYSDAYVKP